MKRLCISLVIIWVSCVSCSTMKDLFNSSTGNYEQMAQDRTKKFYEKHNSLKVKFEDGIISSKEIKDMQKICEVTKKELADVEKANSASGSSGGSNKIKEYYAQKRRELDTIMNNYYSNEIYKKILQDEEFCVAHNIERKVGWQEEYLYEYEKLYIENNIDENVLTEYIFELEKGSSRIPIYPQRADMWREKLNTILAEKELAQQKDEKRKREIKEYVKSKFSCRNSTSNLESDGNIIALDNIIYMFTTDVYINARKKDKPYQELDREFFEKLGTFEGHINGIVDKLIDAGKTLDEIKSEFNSTIIRDYFNLQLNEQFYDAPQNYLLVKIDMNNNTISYTAKINGNYVDKPAKGKFSFKFTGPRDVLIENKDIPMVEGFISKNGENELKSKFFMVSQGDDFVYDLDYFLRGYSPKLEISSMGDKYEFKFGLTDSGLIENTAKGFLSSYGNQPAVEKNDFDKWQYVRVEGDGDSVSDFLIGKYPVTLYEYKKFSEVPVRAKRIAGYDYETNEFTEANLNNNDLCAVLPCQITSTVNNLNSAFDIARFCNKKSIDDDLEPYFEFVATGGPLFKIIVNEKANGYRLPTPQELYWAQKGGNLSKGYKYIGSNYLFEVKPKDELHTIVGSKKPNELGLYDMQRETLVLPTNWPYQINESRNGFLLKEEKYTGYTLRLVRNI